MICTELPIDPESSVEGLKNPAGIEPLGWELLGKEEPGPDLGEGKDDEFCCPGNDLGPLGPCC